MDTFNLISTLEGISTSVELIKKYRQDLVSMGFSERESMEMVAVYIKEIFKTQKEEH